MPQFKIMLARFPGGNREHPVSSEWITQTILEARDMPEIGKGHIKSWYKADTPIYMTRNEAVLVAREFKADYLLMIDEDIEADYLVGNDPTAKPFFSTAWQFLMKYRDMPCAVCAPYGGGGEHENSFEFMWTAINNRGTWKLDQIPREQAAILTGISEIGAAPTGLILYDMRVFHEDLVPWFDYEHDRYKSKKESTEDVFQTRNMSLAWHMTGGAKGGRIYCNWDSWCAHWKERGVQKPEVMPVEAVGKQLRDAVLRGHHFDEKLQMIGEPVRQNIEEELALANNGYVNTDQPNQPINHEAGVLPETLAGQMELVRKKEPGIRMLQGGFGPISART